VGVAVEIELRDVFQLARLSKGEIRSRSAGKTSHGGSDMAVQEKASPIAGLSVKTESAMNARAFVYSPWRFFQVMLAVAWSAFAHPFSSTVIDLDTGRVCDEGREERERHG
jgi:hypothetical protein